MEHDQIYFTEVEDEKLFFVTCNCGEEVFFDLINGKPAGPILCSCGKSHTLSKNFSVSLKKISNYVHQEEDDQ